ncbi:hypothetical protein [Nocardioides sp. CER19]|uniref:hypothetical protein n=1 Tax=Nocardioides sp. CER19 TaxID=3038538 RepID=UPI00244D6232|nr:hypothetical protein [Nocardioides sp. CER19]MDH2416485.1 hypothetical protein [Nocardioides sp. CER19]
MPVGLACAVGTSLCYGVGSVLQSAAATGVEPAIRLDPRLLVRLAGTWRYPVGLALDAVGFVLSLVALRTLPLYVVQSVTASFLAVTAVVAFATVGLRMRRLEVAALVVLVAGLALVGLSAAPQAAHLLGTGAQWLVLGAALALVVAAVPLSRVGGREGAWMLGAVGGLGFGVVAVAARILSVSATDGGLGALVRAVVGAPAFYALLVATPLGLTAYATALQRGTVVQATAPLVVGETVLPALVGLVVLGDHPRPGWGAVAAWGFVLAVGASLVLARFGDVEASTSTDC